MSRFLILSRCALSALWAVAGAGLLPASAAAQAADPRNVARLQACLAKAAERPDEALEDGLIWRARRGGVDAEHCVAVAQIERGDIAAGAQTLVRLAGSPRAGTDEARAALLMKAANAWMLIEALAPAEAALTRALGFAPDAPEVLLDRARVRMMGARWSDAEADLDRVLSMRPDALALRLRAEARMQQARLDAAEADIAEAERIEPRNIETNLVRGRLREARRLGRAPD